MNSKIAITIGCLVVYFAVMIWAAFFTKTGKMKENSIEEFAVGGRNFGFVIVLFTMMGLYITASIYASWFSWAATDGLIPQYLIVYSAFGFAFFYIFAKRIWTWGKKYDLLTQPDYIQLRYKSRPLTYLFGAFAILIEAPWIIIEFAAMGMLMEAITYGAIPHRLGTIIIVVFVMAYILYSGMKSIAITELIQGILSTVIVLFGFIAMIYKLFGGFAPIYQKVMEVTPDALTITNGGYYSYPYWASIIIVSSLGAMGWASMFTRVFTTKSVNDVKKVSWWSALIAVVFVTLLLILGLGGSLIPDAIEAAASQTSFLVMADLAFGPLFMGLCAVVVVAAGMSLISVVMNAHSIIISENFVKPFRPDITSAQRVKLARWSTLIYSLIALAISLMNLPSLYQIALWAYDCIAQIVPMIIFSMYWSRSNKYGAGLGLIAGGTVAIYMNVAGLTAFGFGGGVAGLVVNIVVHVICAYVFPKDPGVDELYQDLEEFEAAQ